MTESIAGQGLSRQAGSAAVGSRIAHALATPAGISLLAGLAAALVRLVLLWRYPFDGLYGQDAYFYLTATEKLVTTWTDPGRLWSWVVDWGSPPISIWPLGYHAQVALIALFTGLNAHAGQLLSLLAGILAAPVISVLFLYTFSDHASERTTGELDARHTIGALLAGLVVAFAPLAVHSSVVFMADEPALFWATLGILATVLSRRNPVVDNRAAWIAGLCLAIASVSRYVYPLLMVPVLAYVLLASPGRTEASRALDAPRLRSIIPFVIPSVMLVGLQLLHNIAHPMQSGASPVITDWSPVHVFGNAFDGPDGHLSYGQNMFAYYVLRPLVSTGGLGPVLLPFLIVGVASLVASRRLDVGSLLLGWWLAFSLFYSGSIYQADRFVLSYLPPLALLSALGVTAILGWVYRQSGSVLRRLSPLLSRLLAAAVLLIVLMALALSARASAADVRTLQLGKEDYLNAARCLQRLDNAGGLPVFSFGVTFTLARYTSVHPRELYFETPSSIDATLASTRGRTLRGYLVLYEPGFEEQWGNSDMGAAYMHLMQAYVLTRVSCSGTTQTLYEIR